MSIQQSFHPTARLSIASVASEILRQWPIRCSSLDRVTLVVGCGPEPWQVFTPATRPRWIDDYSHTGKVSADYYPGGEPSRNAAKRLASSLIKGLRPVNR